MTESTKIWVCVFCLNVTSGKAGDLKCIRCGECNTVKDYISINDIKQLIQNKTKELVMKTMYDGSMGVMVDPDVSVYNAFNGLLKET